MKATRIPSLLIAILAGLFPALSHADSVIVQWKKRYNGPGNGSDTPAAVAVDGAGNVIVTGDSLNAQNNLDYYTAKYAAADGALLWESRYDGPMLSGPNNRDDHPAGVVADSAGNVIVTGVSRGTRGWFDWYTAKYAAASGVLLWDVRYNGPGNGSDRASGIAVDNAGNVIVTGMSTGTSANFDYYTVKYAPVDLDGDNDGLLDSWGTAHFGSTAGQSALDDTDGDGVVELLELAFGTDPLIPGAGAAPVVVVERGYLTTTITKQPGVTYLVQTSATPGAGFSALSTTLLTDTVTTLKVRDNVLTGTQSTRFLRVQVTAAP